MPYFSHSLSWQAKLGISVLHFWLLWEKKKKPCMVLKFDTSLASNKKVSCPSFLQFLNDWVSVMPAQNLDIKASVFISHPELKWAATLQTSLPNLICITPCYSVSGMKEQDHLQNDNLISTVHWLWYFTENHQLSYRHWTANISLLDAIQ